MRCIAIDNQPPVLEMLADNIRQSPHLQLLGTFPNTRQATAFMEQVDTDLMFLDIQMPG